MRGLILLGFAHLGSLYSIRDPLDVDMKSEAILETALSQRTVVGKMQLSGSS